MGDIMRPVPFGELLNRIVSEYRNHRSIFGINEESFYIDNGKHSVQVFGQSCSTPVGPAAGPHTQLAQNIISSYLVGGRFLELKTVQKMDDLVVEKPCIDARDEGYNVEWSTEFTLPKAWDEYIKAWIILHLLEALMHGGKVSKPSFIFNMSVGYDLAGIKTEKMQKYIDCMIDASKNPLFQEYLEELQSSIFDGLLDGSPWDGMEKKLKGLVASISSNISPSVTISTMHGCPPKEIEAICSYMLTEKHLDTFVKLNPTLLGYDAVRDILDTMGFDYITLKRESFEHDLQYPDAVVMLHRLADLAKKEGRGFGVKLTNTLGSVNNQHVLPGAEMYMSGRALYPISMTVAELLSKEFDGNLPISYSGGANSFTIDSIFDCGIRPITLATDMLKPGGYTRMRQLVDQLDKSHAWKMTKIDVAKLEESALAARNEPYEEKSFRGFDTAKVGQPLPLNDCYIAPCVVACPIHQDIPEYVHLAGEGKYADALAVIYDKNALPNITGHICDHQCQYHCTRMDYEGAVQIREVKRIAVEHGYKEFLKQWEGPEAPADVKAAVIGAGPAGLSAAYFLARAAFDVTVFEREADAGGVVRNVIPEFRIPPEVIQSDVEFIKANGAKFEFNAPADKVTVQALRDAGFTHIFYAVGSEKDNEIPLEGKRGHVQEALSFLGAYRDDPSLVTLGKHVVVVGAGNTAMDSARAAKRVPGVEDVTVMYRRTVKEMPADREEYELALAEGIQFIFLANPVSYSPDGTLVARKMALGEPDASGRRRPVETDETIVMHADALLTAIGEHPDTAALTWYGVPVTAKGWPKVDEETLETDVADVYAIGDMQSGPSTIVRCIASARKAVEAAIDKILGPEDDEDEDDDECCGDDDCSCHGEGHHHHHDGECGCGHDHDDDECSCHHHDHDVNSDVEEEDDSEDLLALTKAEDEFFAELRAKKSCITCSAPCGSSDEKIAKTEAQRCLECSYLCNKCVEVCPNRANVALDMRNSDLFADPFQILHLDAYCNECGNCATFCPYDGGPYLKKFTLFSRQDDFENSTNSGFMVEGGDVIIRYEGDVTRCYIDGNGVLQGEVPSEEIGMMIEEVFNSYAYLLGSVDE